MFKKSRSNSKLTRRVLEEFSRQNKSKESIKWSFSKAKRFAVLQKPQTPDFNELPSTLSHRACSFGMGKRWTPINETGKDSPSPGRYESVSCFVKKGRGPVLKGRHKNILPKGNQPGPGAYNPYSPIGKHGPKFSFRAKIINKQRVSTPPPDTYNPSFIIVEQSKFKNISFGKGERSQIGGKVEDLPGPGTYNIPSTFRPLSGQNSSRGTSPVQTKRNRTPVL